MAVAVTVAVAVAVAQWRHLVGVSSWGFSRAVSPQELAVGTGFTHQVRDQLLKCHSGRRCAGRQLYIFSSHSGAAQKQPPLRGPPRLRQDGAMSEGNFPAQIGESLFIGAGITTGGQLHSLIQPGSLTHDSPTFLLEKRINPESCRTFSPTASHACGGAVTGAVGCAMYGSRLSVYMGQSQTIGGFFLGKWIKNR